MAVTDAVLGFIADIGIEAARKQYNIKQNEYQVRAKLTDYLVRQQKYNFDCSLEEEIDFEGLAEYICGSLIDDVNTRLFGKKEDRRIARQMISDKAAHYAQAKTKLSEKRARHLACSAVDILANFYRTQISRDLLLTAAEIEDAVISAMSDNYQSLEKKIEGISEKIDKAALLSADSILLMAKNGHYDEIESNFSTMLKGLNGSHTHAPYYGFGMDGQEGLKSVPLLKDAFNVYPPRFNLTAKDVKVGNTPIHQLKTDFISHAYRHQLPIEFDVVAAQKFLGNLPDPIQHEAEDLSGTHMIIKPPAFPEAIPCNVIIDGNVEVEYLLLRTKEIEDDGTIIITNEEQENFHFRVRLFLKPPEKIVHLSVVPSNSTNTALLKYRIFLKHAFSAQSIALKALDQNAIILSTQGPLPPPHPEQLDLEIEFLQKIVAIEDYFQISISIPEEIAVEDHNIITRLFAMISDGRYLGTCSCFSMSVNVSEELKKHIYALDNKPCCFVYSGTADVELFGQKLSFSIIRQIDRVRLKDPEKTKAKLNVLDDGDGLKLDFISSEVDSDAHFSDMFYSETTENKLLHSFKPIH